MIYYSVLTNDKYGKRVRLETLYEDEARACAQALYDNQGILAEIFEHDVEPKSHDCRNVSLNKEA